MKKLSQKEYEEKVKINTNDSYVVMGEYKNSKQPIKVFHKVCNQIIDVSNAYFLINKNKKFNCPYCKEQEYVDIQFPDLAKNFKFKEQAHDSKYSSKKIIVICPTCKTEYKTTIANYIKAGHVVCIFCDDGFSYPEKFMSNILQFLNISFVSQFTDFWTENYRYDFKFSINNRNYIIEMDGLLGHGNETWGNKTNKDKAFEIDKYKDKIAQENGYEVIRIDCRYKNISNRMNYIKNSIYNSKLNDLLNLNCIDWELCNIKSLQSKNIETINIFKYQTKYIDEIAIIVGIKERTVIKYLKEAMNNGLIENQRLWNTNPYKDIKIPIISVTTDRRAKSRLIYCFEEAKLFKSITDASLYYNISFISLSHTMDTEKKYYKGLHFCYYEDLSNNFDFLPYYFSDEDYEGKVICQYDLQDNLIHIYWNNQELPKKYLYTNIWRNCVGKRKTAYGYKWKFMSIKDKFEIIKMVENNDFTRYYLHS